jgi:hypothetical protein
VEIEDAEIKQALAKAIALIEADLFGTELPAEKCETCRFFAHRECRRRSPRQQQQVGEPRWPMTHAHDWCGEYERST